MKYTHNTHDPNLESTTKTATLFNDLLTQRFAQIVLGNILYIILVLYYIMYGQCLFLYVNSRVDVYFHFHFSSTYWRNRDDTAAARSNEVIDVHSCIYKYIK